MPLSRAVKLELEAELANLRAEKKRLTAAIDKKIEQIQAFLTDEFFQPRLLPLDEPEAPHHSAEPTNGSGASPAKNGEPRGLRHYLWEVFAAHPGGLKAKEVVDAVTRLGYRTTGKTNVRTMVYGELYRLRRLRRLQKTPQGRFKKIGSDEVNAV